MIGTYYACIFSFILLAPQVWRRYVWYLSLYLIFQIVSYVAGCLLHKLLWNWSAHVKAKWGGNKYLYDSGNHTRKGVMKTWRNMLTSWTPFEREVFWRLLAWLWNSRARIRLLTLLPSSLKTTFFLLQYLNKSTSFLLLFTILWASLMMQTFPYSLPFFKDLPLGMKQLGFLLQFLLLSTYFLSAGQVLCMSFSSFDLEIRTHHSLLLTTKTFCSFLYSYYIIIC